MTVRLNLSDDEAHALLLLLAVARKGDRLHLPGHFGGRISRLATACATVRSKLKRSEQRRAARMTR